MGETSTGSFVGATGRNYTYAEVYPFGDNTTNEELPEHILIPLHSYITSLNDTDKVQTFRENIFVYMCFTDVEDQVRDTISTNMRLLVKIRNPPPPPLFFFLRFFFWLFGGSHFQYNLLVLFETYTYAVYKIETSSKRKHQLYSVTNGLFRTQVR